MDDNVNEKSESPEQEDLSKDFIHTLEKVIENFPGRGTTKKHSLLILIRSYYKTSDDQLKIKTISTDELTLSIYPTAETQKEAVSRYVENKRKNFSSLKSSLNKTLRQMWEDGRNPSNIVISKSNTFSFSTDANVAQKKNLVADTFLKKIKKILGKAGDKVGKDFEKELSRIVQEEFEQGLDKVKGMAEKSAIQKATKRLEKKVKERELEVDTLKKELGNLKEIVSLKKDESLTTNQEEALPQSNGIPSVESNQSESALLEKLAKIVREGLKKDIPLLNDSDKSVEDLEKKITDKEKKIIQLMEDLAEKEIFHLKEKREYKDRLEEKHREEQKRLQEKIDKLSQERTKSIEEKTDLIAEKLELEKKITPELEKIEVNYEDEKNKITSEKRKVAKRVSEIIDEEKKFLSERDFARKGFVIKEENIQKMASDQMIEGMELNEARDKLEKEKRTFREELNKKFQNEMEVLNQDFQTQKDHIYHERMELLSKTDELEEEWSKLRIKEEEISQRVESAIEERLAEKNREIAKREEELNVKQEKIALAEKLLVDEKNELVSQMKAGLGGKTSLLKLKELVKKQENLLAQKHHLMESESELKQRVLEGFRGKANDIAREAEESNKLIKLRAKELEGLRKKLSLKAQELNNEKNEAIKKYKEQFDTLIKKKEDEFNEKERALNEKIDALQKSEKELLEKKRHQLELEMEATKRIAEKEDEAIKLLEKNLQERNALAIKEERLTDESALLDRIHKERLNQMQSKFKEKVESINNRFNKISAREIELLEKEKFLNNQSLSLEAGSSNIYEGKKEIEQGTEEELINIRDFELYKKELQEIKEELANASKDRTSVYQEKTQHIENSIDEQIGRYIKTLLSKLGEGSITDLFGNQNSLFKEGDEKAGKGNLGKYGADSEPNGKQKGSEAGEGAGEGEREGDIARLKDELNQMKKSFSEIEKVIKEHGVGSNFPILDSSNEIMKTLHDLAGGLSGAVDIIHGQGDGIASKESFVKPGKTFSEKKPADDGSVLGGVNEEASGAGEEAAGLEKQDSGDKEIKISSKHDENGAAITFGGGNLFTKKAEQEISAQIINFNGNIEEFATSPAFLNAIAQKYNASVLIPAGEFEMGDDKISGASPRHHVKVEHPFVISKYPITNLQFLQFTKETGYQTSAERKLLSCLTVSGGKKEIRSSDSIFKGYISKNISFIVNRDAYYKNPFGKGSDIAEKYTHPVTQVTWWDAMAYCEWLTGNTGIKYRLPSEIEWEYVASNRGMLSPGQFFWPDSDPPSKHSNYVDSLFSDTSPVDYFPKNQTVDGVCDMLGNVWEWTQSDYMPYSENKKSDYNQSDLKVIRGYSFIDPLSKVSFSIRRPERPLHASSFIGFRVVCEEP